MIGLCETCGAVASVPSVALKVLKVKIGGCPGAVLGDSGEVSGVVAEVESAGLSRFVARLDVYRNDELADVLGVPVLYLSPGATAALVTNAMQCAVLRETLRGAMGAMVGGAS